MITSTKYKREKKTLPRIKSSFADQTMNRMRKTTREVGSMNSNSRHSSNSNQKKEDLSMEEDQTHQSLSEHLDNLKHNFIKPINQKPFEKYQNSHPEELESLDQLTQRVDGPNIIQVKLKSAEMKRGMSENQLVAEKNKIVPSPVQVQNERRGSYKARNMNRFTGNIDQNDKDYEDSFSPMPLLRPGQKLKMADNIRLGQSHE